MGACLGEGKEWGELTGGGETGAGGGRGRRVDEKDGERKEGDGRREGGKWRRGERMVTGGGLR